MLRCGKSSHFQIPAFRPGIWVMSDTVIQNGGGSVSLLKASCIVAIKNDTRQSCMYTIERKKVYWTPPFNYLLIYLISITDNTLNDRLKVNPFIFKTTQTL
jgi:hypothetical protein